MSQQMGKSRTKQPLIDDQTIHCHSKKSGKKKYGIKMTINFLGRDINTVQWYHTEKSREEALKRAENNGFYGLMSFYGPKSDRCRIERIDRGVQKEKV